MTDHNNAVAPGGGPDTATVEDISISYPPGISCAQTASAGIGSTCGFSTYLRALIPGIPKETKREAWELGDVRIDDGGADGDTSTSGDNTVFLRPGVFIP